jgi:hypothetical protein
MYIPQRRGRRRRLGTAAALGEAVGGGGGAPRGIRGWRWGSVGAAGVAGGGVAEPPELFQLKCLSHASGAVTHLNRNNPSVPQI